ncbi:MFS transporter [Steroidobacter cummioxidans]|uniref:MFS transporter n=1 Tax=Steroidobacter cummioxidans TaxID=1803913 RepID=UPI000E31B0DE|nr:MFS transporter [Steroidobacter cummioxidans]
MSGTVEWSARAKFQWRVLAPIVLLIMLSSLDRVNISFAALQMNADLGIDPHAYGLAVGMFFVGYLLFQFPSTWVLTRIGARRWIAGCVGIWGTVAALMAFVRNVEELFALRFLLGCAEAGFAPGIVYYCSGWMPQRYRANSIAVTMLAIPASVIIGGPLCGWLMGVSNPLELPGWRWMLLIEGLVTVAMAGVAYFIFVDKPSDAPWLSDAEKDWIARALADEQKEAGARVQSSIKTALFDPRAWLAAGVWCTTLIGANGMMFWLPQVIKSMSSLSPLAVGALAALPWVGVALGMVLNSWHSDKTQERYRHLGIALAMGMVALLLASAIPPSPWSLLLLFVGGVGLGGAQGVFWSIPTGFLHRSAAAAGITLINLVGNVGSLAGPYVIGIILQHSGSFSAPIWFVAAVMGAGTLLLASLRFSERRAIRG